MKKEILILLACGLLTFTGCKKEEPFPHLNNTPSVINDNYKMIISIQDNNSGSQGATDSEVYFSTFINSFDGDSTFISQLHDSCSTSSISYLKEFPFELRNDYNWQLSFSVHSTYDCSEIDMSDVISIQILKNEIVFYDTVINGDINELFIDL